MKDSVGAERAVEIDELQVLDAGGFGAVYESVGDPGFIVKHVPFEAPEPVGNVRRYIAHIRTTRSRLLDIRAQELSRDRARPFVVRAIDEIVERSLSTHWRFNQEGSEIDAVWFRQRRAPGRKLLTLLHELPAPPVLSRTRIAQNLIARMRTLRRSGMVHLDCVPDNIFVDGESVTLIDLDGSGIVRQASGSAGGADAWDHPPLTLGHVRAVRPPPWYPQPGIELGPKSGNYLFAERWVVIDTVIRILSWNRLPGALSWIEPSLQRPLVEGHAIVRRELAGAKAAGRIVTGGLWTQTYERVIGDLRSRSGRFPEFVAPSDQPACLVPFARLAQAACLDHRALATTSSPYTVYRDWLV